MSEHKYKFPIKRIGNETSPKLVILLCNPGGSPNLYKRLPEYAMDKDGVLKDSGMSLDLVAEYSSWFDSIIKAASEYGLKTSDLLFLEYYPYHTPTSRDVPKEETWDKYAEKSLAENTKLLLKHMDKKVPVFGYYWGNWLTKVDLISYKPYFYQSPNCRGKSLKITALRDFLNQLQG